MKKFLISIMAITLSLAVFTACGNSTSSEDSATIDALYGYFSKLAEIPRPTYSEKQVSDYLRDWAKGLGYEVTQDEKNNIIFDVPATEGMENSPKVVLQGHMDMVCVAEDGYKFDPKTDPIKVKRDGNMISAEHTSLGADDGMGISIIQYIVENNKNHGPLRVIITTDEEQTSTGASNLGASVFSDVNYLINIDGEESNKILVSSASNNKLGISKTPTAVENQHDTSLEISVSGGKGGHSGVDIDKGRANSIIEVFKLLDKMRKANIDFQIVKAEGGTTYNSIPASAKVVVSCDAADKEAIETLAEDYSSELQKEYGKDDSDVTLNVKASKEQCKTALSAENKDDLIDLAININNGVYTMSSKMEGFVECSSNLGKMDVSTEKIELEGSVRSSENKPEQELLGLIEQTCKDNGFAFSSVVGCKAWPIKENSKLTELAKSVYKEQNGEDAIVSPIHGGLECGGFSELNPDMDIISVGPDLVDVHSIKETCDLASAAKIAKMIEGILAQAK